MKIEIGFSCGGRLAHEVISLACKIMRFVIGAQISANVAKFLKRLICLACGQHAKELLTAFGINGFSSQIDRVCGSVHRQKRDCIGDLRAVAGVANLLVGNGAAQVIGDDIQPDACDLSGFDAFVPAFEGCHGSAQHGKHQADHHCKNRRSNE